MKNVFHVAIFLVSFLLLIVGLGSGASGERLGGTWDLDRCIPFVRGESGLDEELLRWHKDAHGVFCALDDAKAPCWDTDVITYGCQLWEAAIEEADG